MSTSSRNHLPPMERPHMPIMNFRGPYAVLSNFTGQVGLGDEWPTAEHMFQAAKTLSPEWRERIRRAPSPREAKRLGGEAPLRPDWEDIKINQMRAILQMKFALPVFRAILIETGEALLVEGNSWCDNFWGDCTCKKCVNIPGENWLGRLLMELRGQLQRRHGYA